MGPEIIDTGVPSSEYKSCEDYKNSNVILYQNIRSLRGNYPKLKDVLTSMNDNIPQIIALQECWSPHPWQLTIAGYHNLEIKERIGKSHNKGGGIGCYIRNDTNYYIVHTEINNDIEIQILRITYPETLIMNVYRPPKGNWENFVKQMDAAMMYRKGREKVVIGGDFNVDFINTQHNFTTELVNWVSDNELVQKIYSPTRIQGNSCSLLDNIFTTETSTEGVILLTDISDHLGVAVPLLTQKGKQKRKANHAINQRDTRPENLKQLNDLAKATNWNFLTEEKDPCNAFYNKFVELYDICCPIIRKKTFNRNYHPRSIWMTYGLLVSRRKKAQLHKTAAEKNEWDNYKRYRMIYNKTVKLAKILHLNESIKKYHGNGKKIWDTINNYINRQTKSQRDINKIRIAGQDICDNKEMAKAFNTQFSKIGEELSSKINNAYSYKKFLGERKGTELKFEQVTKEDVVKLIRKMEAKRSTGHDGISNFVLKSIAEGIAEPLTLIINHIIKTETFPKEWKLAKVVPIYKNKGNPEEITNYRPISLLPTMSKIIEKILDKQIRDYMNKNEYFAKNQYGFRKGSETTHAVIKAQELILDAKKLNKHSIAIYMDLQKAFDTVKHTTLLGKLEHYGIGTKLIKSYLHRRNQYTEIQGQRSKKLNVNFGVPQGSILGPLLFLILINDLPEATEFDTILFADDTTLITSENDKNNLIDKVNRNLKVVSDWFDANSLTVHSGKTNFMVFNTKDGQYFNEKILLKENKLERIGREEKQKTTKFVGLHIDDRLSWKPHIDNVVKKVASNLHIISANKKILPLKVRVTLYNAFIKPYMDYGSEVWGLIGRNQLEKIQKRCMRITKRQPNFIAHTDPIFAQLNVLKFKDVVELKHAALCYKFKNNKLSTGIQDILQENQNRRSSRNAAELYTPRPKTNQDQLRIKFAAPKIWNSLPESIRTSNNLETFKRRFKVKVLGNYRQFKCTTKNCRSCLVARPFQN